MDQVLKLSDISVLIGDGECKVIHLASDLLRCEPPKVRPEYGAAGKGPRDSITVQVLKNNPKRVNIQIGNDCNRSNTKKSISYML